MLGLRRCCHVHFGHGGIQDKEQEEGLGDQLLDIDGMDNASPYLGLRMYVVLDETLSDWEGRDKSRSNFRLFMLRGHTNRNIWAVKYVFVPASLVASTTNFFLLLYCILIYVI